MTNAMTNEKSLVTPSINACAWRSRIVGGLTGEMNNTITVWEDGTWKLWKELDAYYARNDTKPDWFLEVKLEETDILELFNAMCVESITIRHS